MQKDIQREVENGSGGEEGGEGERRGGGGEDILLI